MAGAFGRYVRGYADGGGAEPDFYDPGAAAGAQPPPDAAPLATVTGAGPSPPPDRRPDVAPLTATAAQPAPDAQPPPSTGLKRYADAPPDSAGDSPLSRTNLSPKNQRAEFDIAKANEAFAQRQRERFEQAMGILQQSHTPGLSMLASAGAMLQPTKTGSFTEALGNAFQGYVGPEMKQRELQEQMATRLLGQEEQADYRQMMAMQRDAANQRTNETRRWVVDEQGRNRLMVVDAQGNYHLQGIAENNAAAADRLAGTLAQRAQAAADRNATRLKVETIRRNDPSAPMKLYELATSMRQDENGNYTLPPMMTEAEALDRVLKPPKSVAEFNNPAARTRAITSRAQVLDLPWAAGARDLTIVDPVTKKYSSMMQAEREINRLWTAIPGAPPPPGSTATPAAPAAPGAPAPASPAPAGSAQAAPAPAAQAMTPVPLQDPTGPDGKPILDSNGKPVPGGLTRLKSGARDAAGNWNMTMLRLFKQVYGEQPSKYLPGAPTIP